MTRLTAMGLIVAVPGVAIFPLPLPFELYKWLLAFFLTGIGLSVLLRADYAKRSMVNMYPTHLSFVKRNWVTILIRIFPWSLGAFYTWTLHPDWPSKIALFFKVPTWLADWGTIPVNVATSCGFGFIIDILLDKVQAWTAAGKDNKYLSWLNTIFQGRLPEYDAAVVDVASLSPDRKVGE